MNDDTISRQAAIDTLERKKDKNAKGDIGGFYNKIIQNDIDALVQLPSAERHGRWKIIKYPTGVEAFGYEEMTVQSLMCSNCSYEIDVSEGYFEYCPNCGSFMDLEYEE